MRSIALSAVAAVALLGFAATAEAKDGYYFAPSAGYTMVSDFGDDNVEISFDGGWTIGAAIGFRTGQFRLEGEVSYLQNGLDEARVGRTTLGMDGDLSLLSGNIGGYYDFAVQGFTPYVGLGVGYTDIQFDGSVAGVTLDVGNSEYSIFAEAGVSYPISDRVELVPAYRYTRTNTEEAVNAHSLKLGLRYSF